MIVFKNYLKMTKNYIAIIMLYSAIFISFAVVQSLNQKATTSYQKEDIRIAIIDHDQSQLTSYFKEYISKNAIIENIGEDEESLKDALFFRQVDYIMIIPQSFGQDFINDQDVQISTMQIPDAYEAVYGETLMNRYLNTLQLYLKAGMDVSTASQHAIKDLSIEAVVHMESNIENNELSSVSSFYNFSNYALLSIIIVVISMIMVSFHHEPIQKRNLVSPLKTHTFQFQLILGNMSVAFGIWLIYIIISFIMYRQTMMSAYGLLYILNSLCLLIFILLFAFLLTKITDNRELISGIANVVSLGSSFLCGAFVPQAYLGQFVLNIAHFLPSYWFIKNNNEIALLTHIDYETIQPLLMNMGIILVFALLCYLITLLVSYFQRRKA